jgi:CHAT domain-containing protein
MAGANNTINKSPDSSTMDDDGILYADEIANVNLSSIDLLVLSACQSGLGDIASSEGVFGLQRGFKLAGVHSIVMSMWDVDDEFTKMLMTRMYRYLGEGRSKRQAFTNAQKDLRSYLKDYFQNDGEFDNPEYWAAFVLLDGLE